MHALGVTMIAYGQGGDLQMREKIEETQQRASGPAKGLLGVLFAVMCFLGVLCAATFLVFFIME